MFDRSAAVAPSSAPQCLDRPAFSYTVSGVEAPVALLSEHYWRSRLGAAPDVLGRTVPKGQRGQINGLIDGWLRSIRDLYYEHREHLAKLPSEGGHIARVATREQPAVQLPPDLLAKRRLIAQLREDAGVDVELAIVRRAYGVVPDQPAGRSAPAPTASPLRARSRLSSA